MSVTSYQFLFILLPLAIMLFNIINTKYRKHLLFLINIFFIFSLGLIPLLIILASGLIYYFSARILENIPKKSILFLTIGLNILILVLFKYNIQISSLIDSVKLKALITGMSALAPIGISFYTFQGISYVVDVFLHKNKAEHDIFVFFSYFMFFGTITSGPIIRFRDFEINTNVVNNDELYEGIKRIIFGLIKKLYLSSRFAYLTDTLWGFGQSDGAIAWVATISFSLQIYLDFSGYSDIAIGISKCFGFNFKENFNYPYIANSLTDFWRRWHISLSLWFRDYIYIPLGGNRVKKTRLIFNMLVVWILTGIWHGTSLTFVVWGLFNFLFILIEKYVFKTAMDKTPKLIRHIYTLILVNTAWVFFRSVTIDQSISIISSMYSFDISIDSIKLALSFIQLYPFDWIIALVVATPLLKNIFLKIEEFESSTLRYIKVMIFIVLLIISITLVISSSYQSFLYEAF